MSYKPASYDIPTEESRALFELASSSEFDGMDSDDGYVVVAQKLAASNRVALARISDAVNRLRHPADSPGILTLRGLPAHETPKRILALIGALLGKLWTDPHEGPYIIEIRAKPTLTGARPSFETSSEFQLHTDLSYSSQPPRYMVLHSLVNNPGEGGYSTLCDIRNCIPLLSAASIRELQADSFLFPAPSHYSGVNEVNFPILTKDGTTKGWGVRFRRDGLRTTSRAGIDAVTSLLRAFETASIETILDAGSAVFVDNHVCLHGRTAFFASEKSQYLRHLNRMYINPH
jgi:L-asparagine oxygenase